MESEHVDRFSRTLATALSRRTSLGAAALLGLVPIVETRAKRRKKKKKKKKKKNQQKKNQSQPQQIECPGGYTACGEQCVDLSDHVEHCGACATVCSPGKTCCQGTCVNLQDNDNHCAACGKRCKTSDDETPRIDAAEICQAGACIECSLEGSIDEEAPKLCCQGLQICAGTIQHPSPRCIPESEAC
ncbi:MAG: hypothetical protein R2853_09830 [Thermomicrobiales bacterium]